ncbi:MAG: HK97 family phage prohead protease [Solirubrobacterales bacterium]
MPAALSSDAEIDRGWFTERLIHSEDAIDLGRARDGLMMLFNHDRDRPIGIVDDVRVDGDKLRGTLRFSPNHDDADRIWRDVRDGFLRDISIGYRILEIDEKKFEKDDVIEALRWEIFESSVVTIPADPSVGANRAASGGPINNAAGDGSQSQREHVAMPKENTGAGEGGDSVVELTTAANELAREQGKTAGVNAERARCQGIEAIFTPPRYRTEEFEPLKRQALDGGWTPAQTREALLNHIGGTVDPIGGTGGVTQPETPARSWSDARIESGETGLEKFVRGAELALAVRCNIESDKELIRKAREGELLSLSFPELAREYMRAAGGDLRGLRNNLQTVVKAMQFRDGSIGQGSGSLTSITENIANKALLLGYEEQEETWRLIARVNTTTDFKQFSRTGLSSFEDLEIVDENGEYKLGQFGDRAEKGVLVKYGKRWGISMEALANDELGALLEAGRKMGRAGQRSVGNAVYSVLTTNAVLNQDGVALFDAAHNNIMTDGGLPTIDRLDEMMVAMATQTDSSGSADGLNIPLARIVTPVSQKTRARVLSTSENDPHTTGKGAPEPNPFQGTFVPVADARLSGTTWYGTADPNAHDTIEVTFLNGQDEPLLLSKEGWTVDGIEMKVMMPCVAIALDFRTMTRNPGA